MAVWDQSPKQTWRERGTLSSILAAMERRGIVLEKLPQDAMAPKDAAAKYGLSWGALRSAICRKRLTPIRYGSREYLTDREMKNYMKNRNALKIPKKFRRSV